jgi:CheY-like chemotaxis protein
MQSIGVLAGGVAHEFNNLLAGINGYAALGLREVGLSPTLRQFLGHVVDLSERAAVLTRQLLAFARRPALTRQRTLMADVVRSTGELVQRTIHREIRLEIEDAVEDEPLAVKADANQLQQALVNLALNARDALAEREALDGAGDRGVRGAITFRLYRNVVAVEQPAFPQHVPAGDYVVLEVEDEGVGMTPEVLTQAIDPFFTTKEVGQGTGLGLPMVFGIVQGHHGFMTMDAWPGRGACVRIYLPRFISDEEPEPAPLRRPTEFVEPESQVGCSILVIDDEEAVLDVVRRFLQIAGHSVTCVSRGHDALDILAAGRIIDLIVLDLMMPREDAAVTFQRLRQRRPGVPVLLCTGLPHAEPAPELLRHEGVGLIRKPFRMNELWYAVRQALVRPAATETEAATRSLS